MSKKNEALAKKIVSVLGKHQLVESDTPEDELAEFEVRSSHHVAVVHQAFVYAAHAETEKEAEQLVVDQIVDALDSKTLVLSDTWAEDNLGGVE